MKKLVKEKDKKFDDSEKEVQRLVKLNQEADALKKKQDEHILKLVAELTVKQAELNNNSLLDTSGLDRSTFSDGLNKDKIQVFLIPGTQFVTIQMPNEKGEVIKRNVKLTETEFSRDTLIESVTRDNSLFRPDNDIIELRRQSLIFGKQNIFGGG